MANNMQYKRQPRNIFELKDVDELSCEVECYHTGLADLRISVSKETSIDIPVEHPIELIFSAPYFFDGPLGWKGADFRLASEEEKRELCNKLGWLGTLPDNSPDGVLQLIELFIVQNANYRVRILARDAYRVNT